MHLIFSYMLVALVLAILIVKIATTPRQYRNQYLLIIWSILLVVSCNAVFLFRHTNELLALIDFSIPGYSVGLYLMFWSAFRYREKNMLESLSMSIFSGLDQGIVLFDYEGKLMMRNRMSERLLRQVKFKNRMFMRDFMAQCGLSADRDEDEYDIQQSTLHCGFRRMRDDDNRVIGNVFVFTDVTTDYDALTGLKIWEKFKIHVMENPGAYAPPATAVLFDILSLDQVNRTYGREVGNQRIRNLVTIIQKHMPKDAVLVRGYEAHIIAICPQRGEDTLRECVETVLSECDGTVIYGMSAVTDQQSGEERSVIRATEKASRSMQVKKLMNNASVHSQALTSLVRALRESDSDTEGHVRRTQTTGELLGRRIGLCDAELSELKLLCLLHDIGKIGIPLEILNKPGRLTPSEVNVLHTHAEKGFQIAMTSDELKPIAPMILSHHECWDGSGYPRGLSGNQIPLLSRIISIVDAYDAMVNNRSYRKGMSPEAAQAELRRAAGSQFDPVLTEQFLRLLKERPELAVGELTGGEEIQVIVSTENIPENAGRGDTVEIPYCRYLLDLDEYIIDVDQRFEAITGYTSFDVLKDRMRQTDLIPQDQRDEYVRAVNNQFAKGTIAYLEHNIRRKDGTMRRVCCMGKRYFDSAEKAFRSEIVVFAIAENIAVLHKDTASATPVQG